MDRLPLEVLKMVVSYLDTGVDSYVNRESLKRLRLVNNRLKVITTAPLFHTVPLWLSIDSLQSLSSIAEHPSLAPCVSKIIFSPLQVRTLPVEEREGRRLEVKEYFERRVDSMNAFHLRYAKHTTAMNYYLDATRYLVKDKTGEKIMTRAFRRLPNLQNVEVAEARMRIGAAEIYQLFGQLDGQEVSLSGEYALPTFMKALYEAEIKPKRFALGAPFQRDWIRIEESTTHKRTLPYRAPILVMNREFSLSPAALKMAFCGLPYDRLRNLLRSLETLEIRASQAVFHHDELQADKILAISQLVRCADPRSRLLIHDLGAREMEDDTDPPLFAIFSNHHCRMIAHMDLRGFKCNALQARFIFIHRTHYLVTVKLATVRITSGGDWSSVLLGLRAHAFPRLESFLMKCCDHNNDSVNAMAYITHRSDQDPFAPDESE